MMASVRMVCVIVQMDLLGNIARDQVSIEKMIIKEWFGAQLDL